MSKIYCFAYSFFVTKIYTWWKYSGPSGLGSFFWKVVFSRVLGSRFFANSFFIVIE